LRAPSDDERTDVPVEASPSAKAPPRLPLEVVEKDIGAPVRADKSDSPPAARASVTTARARADATDAAAAGAAQPETKAGAFAAHRVYQASLVGNGALPAAVLHGPASLPSARAHGHAHAHAAADRAGVHAATATRQGTPSPSRAEPAAARASTDAAFAPSPAAGTLVSDRAPSPASSLLAHFGVLSAGGPDAALFALAPPPPLPAMPGSLLAQVAEDLSLRATIMPERAVLSLDTGGAGELALHLRVKDGVADVRLAGSAAETLEVRPQELRAALASEGLTLGTFDSGQSSSPSSRQAPHDADPSDRAPDARAADRSLATPAAAAAAADPHDSTSSTAATRGVHVTA
jgi:hypothetical protein